MRIRGATDLFAIAFTAAAGLFAAPSCILWDVLFDEPEPHRSLQAIDLYFYDLNTGRLFIAKSDQIPPIDAPSGPLETPQGPKPAGVRAHVFACGECPNVDGMTVEEVEAAGAYIAYLEMYTEQAKQAMSQASEAVRRGDQQPPPPMMVDPTEQTLVKRPSDVTWKQMYSQEGYELADQAVKDCPDGSPARACRP